MVYVRDEVDRRIRDAVDRIYAEYGDRVSVREKSKALLKFGRNPSISTSATETVWQVGGDETYPTTNAIDKISSSDAGDTQEVVIEGHTISNGLLTFVTQTITLTGQTPVTLPTPIARANRFYNNNSTNLAGTVYVYEDDTVVAGVPQTTAKVHLETDGTTNQSLKCATSISQSDYWIITQLFGGVRRNSGSPNADFSVEQRQVSTSPKVFRSQLTFTATATGKLIDLDPAIIVPKNHDWRIVAGVGTNSTSVLAWANGYLASIINA